MSNQTARFISAGGFNRKPTNKVLTVAASTYVGQADFYCDGTADEVEINNAINLLSLNGGSIQLTEGTFTLAAAVLIQSSNISLIGSGKGTILSQVSNAQAVLAYSASGISNVSVSNLQIVGNTSATSHALHFQSVTNGTIGAVYLQNPAAGAGIYILNCDTVEVINCVVDGNLTSVSNATGIRIDTSPRTIVTGNTIKNLRGTASALNAILTIGISPNIISSNSIFDVSLSATGLACVGVYCSADQSQVNNNRIEKVKHSATALNATAIYIVGSGCSVVSNYCFNNGADTGIANTTGGNFFDGGNNTQFSG